MVTQRATQTNKDHYTSNLARCSAEVLSGDGMMALQHQGSGTVAISKRIPQHSRLMLMGLMTDQCSH